ncbi:hypothetical protein M6B38_205955 [Iris pallida]|uniref:Uncharacterized protein n=1 Tax=Iris pallida TaxID=29817 RepID=A0AAX6E6U5_IRIPA|nr:hypothetical protein M6B38_205955 [Iris pallida]
MREKRLTLVHSLRHGGCSTDAAMQIWSESMDLFEIRRWWSLKQRRRGAVDGGGNFSDGSGQRLGFQI